MDIKYAWTDASSHSSLPFLLPSLSLSPSPCFYHFPVFYSRRRFSLCIHIPPLPRLVPALLGPAGSLSFFSRRAISSQRVARSARVHVLSLESAGQTGARHSTDTCITTPKGGNLTSRGQHLLPLFVSSNLILKSFSLSLFLSPSFFDQFRFETNNWFSTAPLPLFFLRNGTRDVFIPRKRKDQIGGTQCIKFHTITKLFVQMKRVRTEG